MSDQNKATARRFYDAWTAGDLGVFDEIITPDARDHDTQNPHGGEVGPDVAKQTAELYRAAFPDTRFEVEQQLADGDYVITRWVATGTNDGELMGMPATGKTVRITGISIDRFEGDKIAESWANWDTLGMMQQLGVVPVATHA
jgi:steroid delta-isomerase-like uncharacterized protein